MEFYETFLKLCNQAGKSPSRVALDIGSSKTMVNGWKTGKSNPSDATLSKLAEYFGVPISVFRRADNQNLCIYDRYVALCNMVGKSPSAAAVEAGISKPLPTKWKQNPDAVPNGTVLRKLAKYFDVSVDYFYSEAEDIADAVARNINPAERRRRVILDDEGNMIQDDAVSGAFWGGDDPDLTPEERAELWDDMKDYYEYKKKQLKERKKGK